VADAQESRRQREAEEAGARQAEELLRGRQDAVVRQLQRVHQRTAATFVDQAMEAAMSAFAGDVAAASRTDAVRKPSSASADLDTVAAEGGAKEAGSKYSSSSRADAAAAEADKPAAVVRDLVQGFLLPDVEQDHLRKQLQAATHGAREAARASLAALGAGALLAQQSRAARGVGGTEGVKQVEGSGGDHA